MNDGIFESEAIQDHIKLHILKEINLSILIDLFLQTSPNVDLLIDIFSNSSQLIKSLLLEMLVDSFQDLQHDFFKHVLSISPREYPLDQVFQIRIAACIDERLPSMVSQVRQRFVDLLFDTMLLDAPEQGQQLQSAIFRILKTHESLIENVRLAHLLSSRIAYLWIEKKELDVKSIRFLLEIMKFSPLEDLLCLRIIATISALILLEIPSLLGLIEILMIAIKGLVKQNDGFARIGVFPFLNALTFPRNLKDSGCSLNLKILQEGLLALEVTFHDVVSLPLVGQLPPMLYNPIYQAIFYLVSSGGLPKISSLQSIPGLRALLFSLHVFQLEESIAYEALIAFTTSIPKYRVQDLLKLLCLFVYLVKMKKYTHFVLVKVIPSLSIGNDLDVTSACLKISKSIIQSSSKMHIIGLESIISLHSHQKRVWPHVKNSISSWAHAFKGSILGGRNRNEVFEIELEGVYTKAILDFSKLDPQGCGVSLLPVIVSLLKMVKEFGSARDLSENGTDNLLCALNACVRGDVTAPQTGTTYFLTEAWNVIFNSYHKSLSTESSPIIYARLCEFFGIVAEKTDGT